MTLTNKEIQKSMTPLMALEILKQGNYRFVNNLKVNRNLLQQVNETKEGQYPFATILSCIDSRTSAELIFDLGLGDIFSVRIAGNIVNDDILGSMEFACKVAGSKIIVVLGHTNCGAVKGVCEHVEMGNLTGLLHKLQPALRKTMLTEKSTNNLVDAVAENNVHLSIDMILEKSPIIKEMVEKGELGIVGGMYNIESGQVHFYEEDIRIKEKTAERKARELELAPIIHR
ncbi:MAG: carbonic anhydrase family protein [Chitinophagales bacterium]